MSTPILEGVICKDLSPRVQARSSPTLQYHSRWHSTLVSFHLYRSAKMTLFWVLKRHEAIAVLLQGPTRAGRGVGIPEGPSPRVGSV